MTDTEKAREARELYELKQKAAQYYQENGVPGKMEDILNSMFYDNPDDVFGHLANYFDGFAKDPLISQLKAKEVMDSRGQPCIQTNVYCTLKNNEKLIASSTSSTESYPPDSAKPEEKEAADAEKKTFISQAIEYINEQLTTAVLKMDPMEQQQIDALLQEYFGKIKEERDEKIAKEKEDAGETQAASPIQQSPDASPTKKAKSPKGKKGPAVVIVPDEPREVFVCGCNAASAVSQAVCTAAANTKGKPLYQHIAALRFHELPDEFRLPLPMVTILHCGKAAPGKLNGVKEFMVVPQPEMPFSQSMKHIAGIYEHCAKTLSAKVGMIGQATTEIGALCPQFDRPEQGLDLLQEAITQQELTPGEHFHIALTLAGQEIFDYDKGKYDVISGMQKTAEDLGDYWGDILNKYPSIIALIDPMRKQEKDGWVKLCEKLSEKCYIMGEFVHHRPAILKDEELSVEIKTSGVVLKMEHADTVSDVIAAAKYMEDAGNQLVIAASTGDTTDTFLVDLAIGLNSRFLKLGGLQRGEKVAKLNHLLDIEEQLLKDSKLAQWSEHTFPLLKPPTPPPEEEQGEEHGTETPTGDKK